MTRAFAVTFAEEWIAAWNSHDLDRILSHYSDDFSITTPMAMKFVPGSDGTIKGKAAVRAYWAIGLEKIPGLEFRLLDLMTGVNGLTIYCVNTATNRRAAEVMSFNGDLKVERAIVHYSE